RLAAAVVDIVDADAVLAVGGRGEADEGIRPISVVILRDGAAVGTLNLQARVERRADSGCLDDGGGRLPLLRPERPDVHVLVREDAAVYGHGQLHRDGDGVAGDLLLDDFRQIADDEAQRRRRPLAGPQAPGPGAGRGVRGNLDRAGHVPGVVLLA